MGSLSLALQELNRWSYSRALPALALALGILPCRPVAAQEEGTVPLQGDAACRAEQCIGGVVSPAAGAVAISGGAFACLGLRRNETSSSEFRQ